MTQLQVRQIRRWLLEDAAPLWLERGLDRVHGGAVEKLTLDGAPVLDTPRRLRVAGRQIYCFAQLHAQGLSSGAAIAEALLADTRAKAWRGPDQGWVRRLGPTGETLDPTPDLYDTAFMLFACAWAARVNRSEAPLALAEATLDFLDRHMRAPAGGFWHEGTAEAPPGTPRLQNPHMHLLEAAHALWETDPRPRFKALAEASFTLFQTRFYEPSTGVLYERFTADLARLPGEEGRIVEPGHHFEWAWLAQRHATLFGVDVGDAPERLTAFAERWGVDARSGRVCMAVRDDGAPVDRSSRTWTVTEQIKAYLALAERGDGAAMEKAARAVEVLFGQFLAGPVPGAWMDHLDADGAPLAKDVPASTFYHVLVALVEVLRVRETLPREG